MADDSDFTTNAQPTLQQLATFLADELFDKDRLLRVEHVMRNAHAYGATTARAAEAQAVESVAVDVEAVKKKFESIGGAISAWLLSLAVENAFEVDVDNSAFAQLGAKSGRRAVSKAVTEKMIQGLTGGSTSVEPSAQPAANYLSVVFGQIFESWALGEIVEVVSAFIPFVDKIEHVADLGDKLVSAMGISDSSSRVLRPYIDTLVVEPLRRYIATTYRPNLHSVGDAIDLGKRGLWNDQQVSKELAVQGYSDQQIGELKLLRAKFVSVDDLLVLVREGILDRVLAVETLMNQGWEPVAAERIVAATELKRVAAIRDNSISAIVRAFVNGDITESEFRSYLPAIITDDTERTSFEAAALIERALNVRRLSHGEVIDCVELKVLPVAAYRRWLEREGYPEEDRAALELRLVVRMQRDADVEKERERIQAEREAEKKARAEAAARRLAEIEAERALHRRGSIADLRRAVIVGQIPISRFVEVLGAQYDTDTVQILVAAVEADRLDYVAQQLAAEEARRRAAVRNVDVGALENAVLANLLTVQEFRGRLVELKFTPADADLLARTLAAKKADRDAAVAQRIAAEEAAKHKSIDLGRMERLVRRGVRSVADYAALLSSLGFDDAARAGMIDLLQLDIDDDAEARRLRDEAAARRAVIGITLEQFRRGVLLGVQTYDAFASWLIKQGYTSDAQLVLLAELRRDVGDAEAARRRRDEAEARGGVAVLSLARVAQAARLGFITLDAYQRRLERAGYSKDDLAIEMELLIAEIAEVQAARARRDELAGAVDEPKAVTLAQVERAVKAGVASINDYRAAAQQLYGPEDVGLLVATLQSELAALDEARARRTSIEGELTARTLSLGQLEEAVKAGVVTLADYNAQLVSWGYGSDDADLLTTLLFVQLQKAGAA